MSATASAFAFAPAKINLFLHVGDKRADGYHELCSLAAFADVGDEVGAELADTLALRLSGPFAPALEAERDDNLVLKAASALQDWAVANDRKTGGASLTLHKNLPVASGIGGGSSDAAATLKALTKLWQLKVSDADVEGIAAKLGADVPVCLRAVATLMQGIGEKLTEWPGLAPLPAVLVNPRVSVMTADVFRGLEQRSGVRPPDPKRTYARAEVWALLAAQRNDLQAPACGIAPIIGDVLRELDSTSGRVLSRMSGSGATCFALYDDEIAAAAAAEVLAARHPHWWVKATTLR